MIGSGSKEIIDPVPQTIFYQKATSIASFADQSLFFYINPANNLLHILK